MSARRATIAVAFLMLLGGLVATIWLLQPPPAPSNATPPPETAANGNDQVEPEEPTAPRVPAEPDQPSPRTADTPDEEQPPEETSTTTDDDDDVVEPDEATAPETDDRATVRLHVDVQDTDGHAIPGASVTVSTFLGRWTQEADESGRATFDEIPLEPVEAEEEELEWLAEQDDSLLVIAQDFGFERSSTTVSNPEAGQTRTKTITLARATMLSFRPIDMATGEPVEIDKGRSVIELERDRGGPSRFNRMNRNIEVDEDDGTVYLQRVRNGDFVLNVWPAGYNRVQREVTIARGEDLHLGTLSFQRGSRFLLQVRTPDDQPIPSLGVSVVSAELEVGATDFVGGTFGPRRSGRTDSQGECRTGLIGGTHAVFHFQKRIQESETYGRSITIHRHFERVDPRKELIRVRVVIDLDAPTASVSGVARDADGNPLAQRRIFLVLYAGETGGSFITFADTTDEHGRFRFEDVASMRYRLSVRPGLGPLDPDDRFRVDLGEQVERDYSLADDMTTGRLLHHDGSPAVGLPVALLPNRERDGEPDPEAQTRTDSAGRFAVLEQSRGHSIGGSGRRSVWVRVEVEPESYIFLRGNVPLSRELGDLRLTPLDPGSRGDLVIRVIDAHSRAPAEAEVRLESRSTLESVQQTLEVTHTTTLANLEPGEYRVRLLGSDFARVEHEVVVEAGQASEVEIAVAARAAVQIRVTLADGGAALPNTSRVVVEATSERLVQTRTVSRLANDTVTQLPLSTLAANDVNTATIRCPGYEPATLTFTTGAAETTQTFDIVLQPASE